jgi:hypothetical protein
MSVQYVEVYTGNGMLDAETVKLFLESAGLTPYTSQESVGQTYGLTLGTIGESHVYVPIDQESEALRLIQSMQNGEFIDEDTGEQSDPGIDSQNEGEG